MPSLGPAEILVVLVVALLVFGPNKMPEIAKQVGKGFREFRRVQQHLKSELRDVVSEFDQPTGTPTPVATGDPVPMLPPRADSGEATSTVAMPDEGSPIPAPSPPTEVALPAPVDVSPGEPAAPPAAPPAEPA